MDTFDYMNKSMRRRSKGAWWNWEDRESEDNVTPTQRLKELQQEPEFQELD